MKLFDQQSLSALLIEFRRSMRKLLGDLCHDFEKNYVDAARRFRIPTDFFRFLGDELKDEDYSQWKVVGWIEELNDLLYFVDLHEQLKNERDPQEFAQDLFLSCGEQFYENSYQEDLFPRCEAGAAGLPGRLSALCARLARQVIQESLFLVPGLPCRWLAATRRRLWTVPCDFSQNFERAELAGCVYVGLEETYYPLPVRLRRKVHSKSVKCQFVIRPTAIGLRIGRETIPVLDNNGEMRWYWRQHTPLAVNWTSHGRVTLGSSLIYGKDKTPSRVGPTPPTFEVRLSRALDTIKEAWPEGAELFASLTSRIIPLKARGVVSFSYRHRPGLTFINCYDRDNLDLIDDLIHENSHHHLNLLLRKWVMYRGDRNQEIFYSPWRHSFRPIRGILHATFTFAMGAMLFERLSTWASGRGGSARWKRAGLTSCDLQRARFRCLEEVESVRYSIPDLEYAGRHLGWLTGSGNRLVGQLAEGICKIEQNMAPHRKEVLRSKYGPALRRHIEELKRARQTYGLTRLRKV